MFSEQEKQLIASKIEEILLALNHPKLPLERIDFQLHVKGSQYRSFADIIPNWKKEEMKPGLLNGMNNII